MLLSTWHWWWLSCWRSTALGLVELDLKMLYRFADFFEWIFFFSWLWRLLGYWLLLWDRWGHNRSRRLRRLLLTIGLLLFTLVGDWLWDQRSLIGSCLRWWLWYKCLQLTGRDLLNASLLQMTLLSFIRWNKLRLLRRSLGDVIRVFRNSYSLKCNIIWMLRCLS